MRQSLNNLPKRIKEKIERGNRKAKKDEDENIGGIKLTIAPFANGLGSWLLKN